MGAVRPTRAIPIVPDALLTYPAAHSLLQNYSPWGVQFDSVTYGPSGFVRVNATVVNYGPRRRIFPSQAKGALYTAAPRGGFEQARSYATVNNGPAVPDGAEFRYSSYFNLDFEFNVGSEAAQREVSRLDIVFPDGVKATVVVPPYAPPRPSTSTNQTPPSTTPTVRQPPADPVPLPGSEAALARLAGTYQTSMGSTLTLAMQGGLLTGQASDGARESVKLALTAS